MPTAQQIPSRAAESALGGSSLGALLSALVELLRLRARLGTDELKFLLRCTHATVQLLLSHAAADACDPQSALSVAERGWRQLPWRLQLHTWPIADRMRAKRERAHPPPAAAEATIGAPTKPGSVAGRFALWLREVAPAATQVERLCSLVLAAAVPALPSKQALVLLLSEAAADQRIETADVHAALAMGLPQGAPLEWQHGVSTLLPVLAQHGLLARPEYAPLPTHEAQLSLVLKAHTLLAAMLLHGVMSRATPAAVDVKPPDGAGLPEHRVGPAAQAADGGGGGEDSGGASSEAAFGQTLEVSRQRACFAGGLVKWLRNAAHTATEPLATVCRAAPWHY